MKASPEIIEFIKGEEAFRAHAYRPTPTDRWTIGYGSTYWQDGAPVVEDEYISESSASDLISSRLQILAVQLSKITNPKCTQQQFDAVLSLCYNVGFKTFSTSTTGSMFQNGQDISGRFSLYNQSGGKVLAGLVARREKERDIYVDGIYN